MSPPPLPRGWGQVLRRLLRLLAWLPANPGLPHRPSHSQSPDRIGATPFVPQCVMFPQSSGHHAKPFSCTPAHRSAARRLWGMCSRAPSADAVGSSSARPLWDRQAPAWHWGHPGRGPIPSLLRKTGLHRAITNADRRCPEVLAVAQNQSQLFHCQIDRCQ